MSPKLAKYLTECRKAHIIAYEGDEHASTINHLCMTGKLAPQVEFTAYDGIRRKANCLLSAEQFLKKHGQYDDSKNKEFHMAVYHV